MSLEIPLHTDVIGRSLQRPIENADWLWDDLDALRPGDPLAQLGTFFFNVSEYFVIYCCVFVGSVIGPGKHDRSINRMVGKDPKTYRDGLAELCARAGLLRPDTAAELLILMGEGAKASRQSGEPEGLSVRFKQAAEAIVVAFGPGSVR